MEKNDLVQPRTLTKEILDEKNKDITDDLQATLRENRSDVKRLRRKLTVTFWVIIILSIIIFIIGVLLLSVPVVAAFGGHIDRLNSLIAAGFGIADLIGLVLYGPIEKIQKLMGDMSQLILVLNSHQTEVSLRLLEMDFLNNRPSVGVAADKIGSATEKNIKIIQDYFEVPEEKK
jgi:uncharacterized membrane protein